MSKPILYSCYRSSASYRVRIALALKGIDYEYRPVNMFAEPGEQFSEEFRRVNPKCELPALQIDGLILTQSLPIIEYLEETRGHVGRPLLPKDPAKRAVVRKLSEIINSGIQPLQNLSVMRYLPPDVSRDQWAQHWINRGFQALEEELVKVAGKFCVADELSMADICLVPQVVNAHRFHVDMSPYPLIERISSSLRELDEFRRTAPEVQPDAPQRGSRTQNL
ncbi:Glutathione S-transferase zeta-1 [Clonorchis sinensis]|uniref:maleylacetoacetate isomerase n=2 Tax=Clonorchis sinensis TaxID=79923 RepID=A0A8T1LXU6_CLOSI|nr:Glutathione S-transferase zeta-1 [Clonorchis sinensis]